MLEKLGTAYARTWANHSRPSPTTAVSEISPARSRKPQAEARASWNLGDELASRGELVRAIELMQMCVDFEREIGHADVEKDARY